MDLAKLVRVEYRNSWLSESTVEMYVNRFVPKYGTYLSSITLFKIFVENIPTYLKVIFNIIFSLKLTNFYVLLSTLVRLSTHQRVLWTFFSQQPL